VSDFTVAEQLYFETKKKYFEIESEKMRYTEEKMGNILEIISADVQNIVEKLGLYDRDGAFAMSIAGQALRFMHYSVEGKVVDGKASEELGRLYKESLKWNPKED